MAQELRFFALMFRVWNELWFPEIARRQAAGAMSRKLRVEIFLHCITHHDTPRFESYTSSFNSSTTERSVPRRITAFKNLLHFRFGLLIHSALLRTGFWIYVKMKAAA